MSLKIVHVVRNKKNSAPISQRSDHLTGRNNKSKGHQQDEEPFQAGYGTPKHRSILHCDYLTIIILLCYIIAHNKGPHTREERFFFKIIFREDYKLFEI